MKTKMIFLTLSLGLQWTAFSQGPAITSWIRNTNADVGTIQGVSNGIETNVQVVQYTATEVYVTSDCMPSYDVGPWTGNPNTPSAQNFVHKITLNPVQNTGNPIFTGLGNIGIWSNGVAIYNPKDGQYWNNTTSAFTMGSTNNGWNRNALYYEGMSFDNCLGHPGPNGSYHHHVNPACLYDATNAAVHSPIIGYAFDGFPVYGAYGFANPDGTGGIVRMQSSYLLPTVTSRTAGPPVNGTYPLGSMCEDYVFTQGAGHLDVHNGRFSVTPEYPLGIYAYFVTIDANLNPIYPFVIGSTYYGTVQSGNTGPMGGHNVIPGGTTVYTGSAASLAELNTPISCQISPNPSDDRISVFMNPNSLNNVSGVLRNAQGQIVQEIPVMQPSMMYVLDLNDLESGVYFLHLESGNQHSVHQIIKTK